MKFTSTCRCRVRGDAQRWLSTEATGTFPCDRSTDPDAAIPLPLLDDSDTLVPEHSKPNVLGKAGVDRAALQPDLMHPSANGTVR